MLITRVIEIPLLHLTKRQQDFVWSAMCAHDGAYNIAHGVWDLTYKANKGWRLAHKLLRAVEHQEPLPVLNIFAIEELLRPLGWLAVTVREAGFKDVWGRSFLCVPTGQRLDVLASKLGTVEYKKTKRIVDTSEVPAMLVQAGILDAIRRCYGWTSMDGVQPYITDWKKAASTQAYSAIVEAKKGKPYLKALGGAAMNIARDDVYNAFNRFMTPGLKSGYPKRKSGRTRRKFRTGGSPSGRPLKGKQAEAALLDGSWDYMQAQRGSDTMIPHRNQYKVKREHGKEYLRYVWPDGSGATELDCWLRLRRTGCFPEKCKISEVRLWRKPNASRIYLSAVVSYEAPNPEPRKPGTVMGLDFGVRNFVTSSVRDGDTELGHTFYPSVAQQDAIIEQTKKLNKENAVLQRQRSKCRGPVKVDKNGKVILGPNGRPIKQPHTSRRYKELSAQILANNAKITAIWKDLRHKVSRSIVDHPARPELIRLEDTTVAAMVKKGGKIDKRTRKALLRVGIGEIRRQTTYKSVADGARTENEPSWYTSQQCHACGNLHAALGSAKVFVCPDCGHTEDRDEQAASTIRDADREPHRTIREQAWEERTKRTKTSGSKDPTAGERAACLVATSHEAVGERGAPHIDAEPHRGAAS